MWSTKCSIFFAGMWMIVCGVFLPHAASSQTTGQRYAIVIGVDQYADRMTDFKDLHYAEKDARAIVKALEAKQFVVKPLFAEDATKSKIIAALAYRAENTKKQDTVLIYFAGHGVKRKFGETEYSYWVPYVETMSTAWDDFGIRLLHLLQYIADIKANHKILLLDHCHSGFEPGTNLARNSPRNFGAPEAFSEQKFKDEVDSSDAKGFTILGAAQAEAYEIDELQHGIFTHVLLEALNSTDAAGDDYALDVSELRKFMKTRIPQVIQELKDAGSIAQNFTQTPFSHSTGGDVDWKLLDVQLDLDSLIIFFGELAVHGDLKTDIRDRVLTAIQNVTEAAAKDIDPDEKDAKIVKELQWLLDRGDQDTWRTKALMLLGAIGGAS